MNEAGDPSCVWRGKPAGRGQPKPSRALRRSPTPSRDAPAPSLPLLPTPETLGASSGLLPGPRHRARLSAPSRAPLRVARGTPEPRVAERQRGEGASEALAPREVPPRAGRRSAASARLLPPACCPLPAGTCRAGRSREAFPLALRLALFHDHFFSPKPSSALGLNLQLHIPYWKCFLQSVKSSSSSMHRYLV